MSKRVAILQGGGTCPGSNDAQRGAITRAEHEGYEVVAIQNGYAGMIQEGATFPNIRDLEPLRGKGRGAAQELFRRPGCFIGTSRTKPLPIGEDGTVTDADTLRRNVDIIRENLSRNQIDILFASGGDDTLARGARRLHEHGAFRRKTTRGSQTVQAVGVPKTIDNDFHDMGLSYGALTAAAEGQEFVRRGLVEAQNNNKLMIIECMGRDCGDLAVRSAVEAHGVLIPEYELSPDEVVQWAQEIMRKTNNQGVLVASEGFLIDGKKTFLSDELDAFGHQRLGGVRFRIEEWLNNADPQIKTMQMCPGYLYRSGPPTEEDAQFAFRLGERALQAAIDRENGVVSYLPEGGTLNDNLQLMNMGDIRGSWELPREHYDSESLTYRRAA